MKKLTRMGENILQAPKFDGRINLKIYKEDLQFNNNKITTTTIY